ncbi:uncharacterized protein A4U43_C08F21970 [Asparagus officinalis]|uniref:uncharacterized protein LOC109822112 n=1 Tax=Asparagus officinalis TaxID=4686 RepID=UPI00098E1F9D|nr:uncharacterized protein LOC109822112 [Asparagus officinalis]ONK60731.1 uncharacterized protein A4U43_C08F21970 [Asparagus officinalis]
MAQLQCELTIIKLTNLYIIDLQPGMLFIRYRVNAGGGRRIRIDTRQISSKSALRWDETSYLECMVPPEAMKKVVCEHNVAFELRWRGAKPIFGFASKQSRLLGRAEVAWEGIPVERSIGLDLEKKSLMEGSKAPTLVVRMGMRVRVLQLREKRRDKHEDMGECKCESCRWIASEEDMFLAATSATMLDTW